MINAPTLHTFFQIAHSYAYLVYELKRAIKCPRLGLRQKLNCQHACFLRFNSNSVHALSIKYILI